MPACGLPFRSNPTAGAIGDVHERSVAVVAVQEVADQIVGDVDVLIAVAIEVAERDAEPLAGGIGDASLLRHVGERAVAVVAIETVGHAVEDRRIAVHPVAFLAHAAVGIVGKPEVQVVGDVEIEIAVAIEIEEPGAGAPLGGRPRRRPQRP